MIFMSLELSVNSMSEILTSAIKYVILKISEKLTWRRSMDKTIGIRLKEARNNVGMYQEDAARSMEMSRPTLSAIEAGKRAVTAEEIKDFAGLYHVTANWLLFGADQEEENRMQETNNQNHTQQTENSINGQGQDMAQAPVFNFETRTVTLNSGYEMPLNGIGTYSLTGDECYNSIISALNSGVRLIDTAYFYGNEAEIGRAIRDSGVPREEIFVITKIYPSQFNDPEGAIEMALEKLDIGYIDMMLLHHPGDGDVEAYKAMEKYVEKGQIRSIGLSNWYIEELDEFLPQVDTVPALVQNEIHPYYQEIEVVPYIQSKGIVMQGWYPFGGRGHTSELLNDETIVEIANNHNVTAAQVILRWNLQRGVVVIPGSSNPDHIKENTEIYHFELTEEEMERIEGLNRDEKHDWY